MRGAFLIVLLDLLEPAIPGMKLPPHWEAVAAAIVMLGRLVQQGPKTPGSPSLTATALVVVLALCGTGCVGADTPTEKREDCYADARSDALAAYLRGCKGHASTRDCPAANGIQADEKKARAACQD
jgi:hypothetical protein